MKTRTSIQMTYRLAATILLLSLTGCGVTSPSAEIMGVKIQNASLTEATLLFDVKVNNPYSVPLPMSNVDYDVSSKGQPFLKGNAELAGTVPAGGSKNLEIPIPLRYQELFAAVKDARPGATIPYKAILGLSVDAPLWGPIRVPVTKEDELTLPSTQGLKDRFMNLTK